MNISDWPLQRVMELPDHLFGRRFLISCLSNVEAQATVWNISEVPFPELTVIWELQLITWEIENTRTIFRIAMGDQLPLNVGMMDLLEPVFPGFGLDGPEPRFIHSRDLQGTHLTRLKHPVRVSGRRLVCEFENTYAYSSTMGVLMVVSSVPRSVPDCYV